jgi:hypothetical protein
MRRWEQGDWWRTQARALSLQANLEQRARGTLGPAGRALWGCKTLALHILGGLLVFGPPFRWALGVWALRTLGCRWTRGRTLTWKPNAVAGVAGR